MNILEDGSFEQDLEDCRSLPKSSRSKLSGEAHSTLRGVVVKARGETVWTEVLGTQARVSSGIFVGSGKEPRKRQSSATYKGNHV